MLVQVALGFMLLIVSNVVGQSVSVRISALSDGSLVPEAALVNYLRLASVGVLRGNIRFLSVIIFVIHQSLPMG